MTHEPAPKSFLPSFLPSVYFGALPREAQLSEPTSRLNEGIFAHADFDDVDS